MSNVESKTRQTLADDVLRERHVSDLRFVESLISGDSHAWQTFIHTHGRLIRSRVADVAASFGRAKDTSGIDDASADVFTALLNNDSAALRAFQGKSSLATYIAVIATRSATRGFAARRLAVATDQKNAPYLERQDARSHDPSRDLVAQEQKERIHTILASLPAKQRKIVELFHLQGCSYAEISRQLKIPIGSVGVTLKRSEVKIRELLEPD